MHVLGRNSAASIKMVACLLSTLVMLYCSIVWGAHEARVAINAHYALCLLCQYIKKPAEVEAAGVLIR